MEYQCHFDYNDLSTIVIVTIQNISHIVVSIVGTYLVPVTRMGCLLFCKKTIVFVFRNILKKGIPKWRHVYELIYRLTDLQGFQNMRLFSNALFRLF